MAKTDKIKSCKKKIALKKKILNFSLNNQRITTPPPSIEKPGNVLRYPTFRLIDVSIIDALQYMSTVSVSTVGIRVYLIPIPVVMFNVTSISH